MNYHRFLFESSQREKYQLVNGHEIAQWLGMMSERCRVRKV
jgi:hypothetical protein